MTPAEHAQLLRGLANETKLLRSDLSVHADLNDLYIERTDALIARARVAAEEIEKQSGRALILSRRLKQLSIAVARGNMNEFLMRIPAEPDRDADFVLDEASRMLAHFGGGEAE